MTVVIETPRLVLRLPEGADRPVIREMFADATVMALLGPTRTADESDEIIDRHLAWQQSCGLGFLTVALRHGGEPIGYCGLKPGGDNTPIEGEVEIGWMIHGAHWRHGYAFEAASALLDWGWSHTGAPRIFAITSALNHPSRALMERLGMVYLPERDFVSGRFAEGSPLRASVTYAVGRP